LLHHHFFVVVKMSNIDVVVCSNTPARLLDPPGAYGAGDGIHEDR
jgi:hypothetical protein